MPHKQKCPMKKSDHIWGSNARPCPFNHMNDIEEPPLVGQCELACG